MYSGRSRKQEISTKITVSNLKSVLLSHMDIQVALAPEQRMANFTLKLGSGLSVLLHDVHLQYRRLMKIMLIL